MSASQENRTVILCLVLVAATLAFYNPLVHNQFIDYDDLSYIQKNNHVLGGVNWEDIKWAFTTARDGNWHPLTWISHALDCQIFGLNPVGHHYTNLLFHAVNAALLFLLLFRATGMTWASLMVGALFALHPVNVESVAWAAERKNVLSMFFFLLTLLVFDWYARRGGRYRYGLAAALFALGLMAKAQIVTLPFVLLLWDYWPLQRMASPQESSDLPSGGQSRSFFYLAVEKLPFFLLAGADSAMTMWTQQTGESVRTLAEVSLPIRLENVLVSYIRYIGKAFWPSHLVPMYPRPVGALPVWQVAGAAVILLLVSALVLVWREERYLAVGWFWFLGTLVPMIGIVTVGEQAMADRYAYIPFIGLFLATVWLLRQVGAKYRISKVWPASLGVAIALAFGCLTYRQIGYWHDSETLWRYTLSVTKDNYVAHNNLGAALAKQGRGAEAIEQYREGNALHAYKPMQLLGLGYYEMLYGHSQDAIDDCRAVLRESSDPTQQAAAWSEMGEAQMQLLQYDQSVESYREAFHLNPEDPGALVGAGLLALRQGQFEEAAAQFLHAVQIEPSDAKVLLYEQALRRAGHSAEADSAAAQVRKLASNITEAQFEAGQLLALVGVKPL